MTRNDKIAAGITLTALSAALLTGLWWPRHEESVIRDYPLQDRRVTIQVLPGRHVTPYRVRTKPRPTPLVYPPTAMLNDAPAPLPDAAIVFPGPEDTYSDPGQPGDNEPGSLVVAPVGLLPGGGAYAAPPAPVPAHTPRYGLPPRFASVAEPPTWCVALVAATLLWFALRERRK